MDIIKRAFSILVFTLVSNLNAASISIRSDLWCPYACDPKSDRPGFMVEIAKEIFQKNGHSVQYEVMNWPRAVADVKNGKYDALVGTSKSDAPVLVYPATPTGVLISYYYTRAGDTWTYKNKDSLKGVKVGVINDYTYGEEIDLLVKSHNPAFKIVAGENPLSRLIQMIENKRIDSFVENPLVLNFTLKEMKKSVDQFRVASPDLASDPDLFIGFAPSNKMAKTYAAMMDAGMVDLRKSGRLKEILTKYGLSDWKK